MDKAKYSSIGKSFGIIASEQVRRSRVHPPALRRFLALPLVHLLVLLQGVTGLFRGWFPTLLGYSAQGAFKFGLYEYFKK